MNGPRQVIRNAHRALQVGGRGVPQHQLREKLGEPVSAQVAAVGKIRVGGEELKRNLGHRLPEVSFTQAKGRHVRTVGYREGNPHRHLLLCRAHNTITIDGVSNKGGAGDWGANFGTPSVDAVQEIQISRNTYDAQYGRVGNGVVSVVTKGGSDEFHGNVFWFHRNDNLDANEWRRNRGGDPKPEFKRNQYGVSASGPIWKQKRIYFQFGYEAMRQPSSASTKETVPTELERAGDFSESRNRDGSLQEIFDPFTTRPNPDGDGFIRDRFAGNMIPASRMDPIGRNITSFMPSPNVDGVPVTNALNFFKTAPANLIQDKWNGRFDYAPTSKFSTFFRVS